MRTTIPVSAASHLAKEYGFDQVVVIARRVGGDESVTTFGKGPVHKDIAARTGEFLQRSVLGWVRQNTTDPETLTFKGLRRPRKQKKWATRQSEVLLMVAENGPISHVELCRRTGIDRATLSAMTAQLHEKGLLSKKRAPDDTRIVNVKLTAKGRKALTELSGMNATGNTR